MMNINPLEFLEERFVELIKKNDIHPLSDDELEELEETVKLIRAYAGV